MSQFELWVKGCEINKTVLYPVEGTKDNALYACWREYMGKDWREYRTNAMYIGWVSGKQVVATPDRNAAYQIWKSRMERRQKDGTED